MGDVKAKEDATYNGMTPHTSVRAQQDQHPEKH